jgi:type IV pilus assembly protein PilM
MTVPFFSQEGRKRDQIVAIDLGTRAVKAVYLQRKADGFELLGYAFHELPLSDKGAPSASVAHQLRAVSEKLGSRTRHAVLALSVAEALVRWVELPLVPVADLRTLLKFNSKTYLQQDLSDHVFDCQILAPAGGAANEPAKGTPKCRALVTAAKRQAVEQLQSAARSVGWTVNHIVPGMIGPANAFELAKRDVFAKEVVALVDVGFKNSSITILQDGELKMGRVVSLGGDRLTSGLAEALNTSYAEAEGIKVGLSDEVQAPLQALLSPLGRELRASIDFFEHQQDKTVAQVFVSGGAARSPFMVQSLQAEMMVPCQPWNPIAGMTLALPPAQMAEVEHVAPQLAVAVGAALAAL